MNGLINCWLRFFYAQCYAFCKSNAYLASQRGNNVEAGEWLCKADEWYLTWWRVGK